jgi:hypothetical protein
MEAGNDHPVETITTEKNFVGENDEKEYLETTADRMARPGVVYRAYFDTGAQ